MQRRHWLGAALATPLLLQGCGSQKLAEYTAEKPVLDLAQYFNGTLDGWGMFQDRSGTVRKRFHVVIEARWQCAALALRAGAAGRWPGLGSRF